MKMNKPKPPKYISKSVKDNNQSAILIGSTITVTNKSGRKKIDSYQITVKEWQETERHPNPNWPKRQLVLAKNKKHMGEDRNPEDLSLMERIVDSQVTAINKCIN